MGIGGEFWLYWVFLTHIYRINPDNLIGISNHNTIITDAKKNIPWSQNYLVNYNDLKSYPNLTHSDLIIVNLSKITFDIINWIVHKIEFKRIIMILCDLPDKKLNLLVKYFIIKKIKYFLNLDGLIRIIELIKK